MINYRLSDYEKCNSIASLIKQIDCKINEMALRKYNTLVFGLREYTNRSMSDLLHYKRILEFKACNPEYAKDFSIEAISGRIKTLIYL